VLLVDGRLHAFYASQKSVNEEDLDASVRKQLPYYSVPEQWRQVESIPLTMNGKINKAELRALAVRQSRNDSGLDVSSKAANHNADASPPAQHGPVETTTAEPYLPTSLPGGAKDPEKGIIVIESKDSQLTVSPTSSISEVPDTLPSKNGFHGQRWLRHRAFILYRRFFSIVALVNLAVVGLLLYRTIHQGKNILPDVATATAANLCTAVLMRSEPVVNLLFTVSCSVPVCQSSTSNLDGTNHTSDVFSSFHPPTLRSNLPHRRHPQRMCARSYHLVRDISRT
jgi:hypothetical protein